MRIEIAPIEDSRWRDLVSAHPDASPFHLPAWSSIIADCYGYHAFLLAAFDADTRLVAGLPVIAIKWPLRPTRWVSLPFTDSCPLLIEPGTAVNDVADAIRRFVLDDGTSGLEVRADMPSFESMYGVEVGYIHVLDLPKDPAELHPNKGHRYSRNRAIRQGVEVTYGCTPEDLASFYRLHTLTRRRHGVPVQPRRFFDLIQQRLIECGKGFVAMARVDGELMAAAVYLAHNETMVAKYHASDPAHPEIGAGYLVDWETMVKGCREGYRVLDMGRSDADADGLRLYKSSWGAEERPLIYTHISHAEPGKARPHIGDLPKRIIRSSPPWVCRALGSALYRWTA